MKKILFVDLDGTILNSEKTISERTREALKQMLDAGHYLVAASGRSIEDQKSVVEKWGLDNPCSYLLGFNGALIHNCKTDQTEKTFHIEKGYVKYLIEEAEKYGLHIQTYASDGCVLAKSFPEGIESYLGGKKDFEIKYRECEDIM